MSVNYSVIVTNVPAQTSAPLVIDRTLLGRRFTNSSALRVNVTHLCQYNRRPVLEFDPITSVKRHRVFPDPISLASNASFSTSFHSDRVANGGPAIRNPTMVIMARSQCVALQNAHESCRKAGGVGW